MDRRKFIKKSALGAAFVGLSPLIPSVLKNDEGNSNNPPIKQFTFVLRGVAYTDAFNAFKKFDLKSNPNFHIQKATCTNHTYSHSEGLKSLVGKNTIKAVQTQQLDRYTIPQVLEDVFNPDYLSNRANVIYFHHTEIGHSSNKLYMESLELFFTELSKHFKQAEHKIIITADIGRNEKTNSCGGRDHSNDTSLETFALFLGGNATKLAGKNTSLALNKVLKQKF